MGPEMVFRLRSSNVGETVETVPSHMIAKVIELCSGNFRKA